MNNGNLHTLLEAAKFLEMQEQKQRAEAEAAAAAAAAKKATLPKSPPTVLIATELPPTILQSTTTTTYPSIVIKKEQPEQQQIVTSTVNATRPRFMNNSFDIRNHPLVIDEGGSNGTANEKKRKEPPMAFRTGTREVHNKLEKHRRAHLKECFDVLKKELPATQDEKKTSNLSILHSAIRFIALLKKKERDYEHEMENLAREKITLQQRLAAARKENPTLGHHDNNVELVPVVKIEPAPQEEEPVSSTSHTPTNDRVQIPFLHNKLAIATTQVGTAIKEVGQSVPTAVSVVPMGYPVGQGLVLQKVLVPKGLADLTPLMSTHFITQQQLNGKVVPLVNAQYVVKPVVVVSRPS